MALHPGNDLLRERILVFGGPGAGKTYDFYKIADFAQATGSEARFRVIDTDNASGRMLATEFAHLENVDLTLAFDWEEMVTALIDTKKVTGPQDWTMIDMVGPGWDMVQEYYVDQIFHQDMGAFFLQARADNVKGNAMDGWKDWSVINRLWRTGVANHLFRWPGHLYATAMVTGVSGDTDSKETIAQFGRLGVKPRGQKDLAHLFHTVLWKTVSKETYQMTTAKDRGRAVMSNSPIADFATQYLMKTAGWVL